MVGVLHRFVVDLPLQMPRSRTFVLLRLILMLERNGLYASITVMSSGAASNSLVRFQATHDRRRSTRLSAQGAMWCTLASSERLSRGTG